MTWTAPEATDQQFRDAGFTVNARQFPLSEAGARWVANFNRTTLEKMPAAWCYAPNEYMQTEIEKLGSTP